MFPSYAASHVLLAVGMLSRFKRTTQERAANPPPPPDAHGGPAHIPRGFRRRGRGRAAEHGAEVLFLETVYTKFSNSVSLKQSICTTYVVYLTAGALLRDPRAL